MLLSQVDVKNKSADVIYTTTDEEENINLEELIKDRSIAFSESHAFVAQHGPRQDRLS